MSLDILAPELIFMIADRLTIPSLASLHLTCRTFHLLLARELLHRAVAHDQGVSALRFAAHTDNLVLVRALLSCGADPNAAESNTLTPLHVAALRGNLSTARLLVQHGANLEASHLAPSFDDGDDDEIREPYSAECSYVKSLTALGCAVCHGHADVAEFLLDEMDARGIASDWFMDKSCGELFQLATTEGYADVVRVFLNRDDVDPLALSWLLRNPVSLGNAEIVEMMIEAGADVEARPSTWRPLHTAANVGHADVVRVLLRHGAEVDSLSHAKHDQPKTALVAAAKVAALGPTMHNQLRMLAKSEFGEEDIERCRDGAWEAVQVLIEWGADVDWAIHLVNGMVVGEEEKRAIVDLLEEARHLASSAACV